MTLTTLVILYLCFRLKQFVCDFLLQTNWMATAKSHEGWNGYKPLLVHAGIHGIGTAILMLIFAPSLVWLGVVDILLHGCIDRLKALLTQDFQWNPSQFKFWWALGADQEAHNLTHLSYIVLVVMESGGLYAGI